MALQMISKERVALFVRRLMAEYEVVGPVEKEGSFVLAPLSRAEEIRLDSPMTLQSPKPFLLPPEETLLRYRCGRPPEVEALHWHQRRILFGIHPCDINAIAVLDAVFSKGTLDNPYMERRDRTLIIGLDCQVPCDEHCFCHDVGALNVTGGYDLFLTDLGDAYSVEVRTEAAQKLLHHYADATPASAEETSRLYEVLDEKELHFPRRLEVEPEELAHLLEQTHDHPLWDELAEKCLGCGSCNLVCPTCFCFDVQDRMEMDLQEGERVRLWDACLLRDFTLVAGGEVFRPTRGARLRHRIFHKGVYVYEDYGCFGCVGCGRCVRACLVDIDPVTVFNTLVAAAVARP